MKQSEFTEWFYDFIKNANDDENYYIGVDENYIKKVSKIPDYDDSIRKIKITLDNGQIFKVTVKEGMI